MCFISSFSVGSVYNVTHYMEYHPGGEEELMKGAGKDATDLFDQVNISFTNLTTFWWKTFLDYLIERTMQSKSKKPILNDTIT